MATEGTTQPSAGAAQEDASTSVVAAPSTDPHPSAGPPDASALDIDFSATEDTDDDDDDLDLEIEVEIEQPHEMTQGGDVPTEEQSSPMLPSSSADVAAAESAAEAPAVAAGEGAGSDSAGQDAAGEQTEVQGADRGDAVLNDTAGTDLTENWMERSITFGTMEMTGALEQEGAAQYGTREMDGTLIGSGGMTHSNLVESLKSTEFRDAYGINPLHLMAAAGDEAGIKKLSAAAERAGEVLDINALDSVGRTPLVYAAVSKSSGATGALLQAGASCLIADVDGRLPLHWASFHGKAKAVKLLLAEGENQLGVVDKEGRTALHWATVKTSGSAKVVAQLLKAGADVSAVDIEGMSALHWAAFHNNPKVCTLLLRAKADARQQDGVEGKTPLHWAGQGDDPACVKAILAADPQSGSGVDGAGRTALHLCVAEDKQRVAKHLLSSPSIDVNAQDSNGRTALHWATALNKVAFAAALLGADAKIDLVDEEGATALNFALQHEDPALVEILIEGGYTGDAVNTTDASGCTPLAWAIAHGNAKTATLLIEANASLDTADATGRTALHTGAFNGSLDCTKLLLDRGADPSLADASSQTPLFPPCAEGHSAVVELLLAQPKVDATVVDAEGRSPMHSAAISGHNEVVKLLAEAGTDVHACDQRGETALHYAAFFGHASVVTTLLERGSDANCLDFDGICPLHWAAFKGHAEALTVLLEAGAYPNFMELQGNKATPYDYAKSGEHFECAELIASYGGVDNLALQEVAAVMIQATWRAFLARKRVRRLREYFAVPEDRKVAAATVLQAVFRGHTVRKSYRVVRAEHRARVAKIDAAKQATMSLEDKAVADAALKHAREREEKQMALAKEMDAHRIAEEKRLREQHDHMRQAEQDALAAKRTLVQQKLEKRNEYVVEKRKAEAERKAIVEETEKIEAELRLEEAKKRQAQRDAEAAAAATAAAERKKVLTKMKMVGRLSAAAKKGKSLVPPTPSTPGDAGSDRTPLSSRLGGRQGSSAWSRRLQPDAASAVHLRDVKVRKHLVETEARRIQTIRVKVAAAGVIQRAWRLYIARRDNGELPPRPPRRPPSEQPQPRAKTPLRKPPLRYTVAADVKVGATAKSLHMTRAAPSLPPLRTNGAGNSTQRGANGPGRGGARRRRNTDKMHKIKLPDILSPEAMIKQAKAETSDTHVEVAALLIQLWWRRYKSRKRREKARLLRTGPGSEAVAALAEQRKKLVHIYAPTKPLVRVVARDRRYVTAHPSELRAARERRGQAVGAGGGGDGRKDSRTRSMPLATQMASMRLSQTLSPYQKVHAETVRQGAGHRGRKRNSMATVRLESLRPDSVSTEPLEMHVA